MASPLNIAAALRSKGQRIHTHFGVAMMTAADNIEKLDRKVIEKIEDLDGVKGVGKAIRNEIQDMLKLVAMTPEQREATDWKEWDKTAAVPCFSSPKVKAARKKRASTSKRASPKATMADLANTITAGVDKMLQVMGAGAGSSDSGSSGSAPSAATHDAARSDEEEAAMIKAAIDASMRDERALKRKREPIDTGNTQYLAARLSAEDKEKAAKKARIAERKKAKEAARTKAASKVIELSDDDE